MAIKKIKIGSIEHELQTTINNVEGLQTALNNKSDTTHKHDDLYDAKGSAANVQTNLDAVSSTLNTHTSNADVHFTATERTKLLGIAAGAQVNTITGIKGNSESLYRTGNVNITKANIGLGNVDNTADANKSVKHATTADSATSATKATQDASGNTITLTYETKTDASSKLSTALSYADNAANAVKNDLLNGAGTAYDTLKELGDLIDDNKDAIEALEEIAANKANATHAHAITDITNLETVLEGKANSSHGTHVSYSTTAPVMDGTAAVGTATTVARSDHKHPTDTSRASKTEFDTHAADATKHITSTERTNWNAAKTHADSAHAPSNAQANQNAFSNIAVSGQTTVAADTTTDTVTFVGSNVSITTDAANDKVTFTVADGTTSAKGVVQLTNSTSSTSTTTAATPNSVKTAYDLANTAKTNAATAQSKADSAYTLAEGKVDSLSDLGITATATELNYMDGVTSNVQTQLDTISDELDDHTHSASDITSGTVAAARLPSATNTASGIVTTSAQTFAGDKTFTGDIITADLRPSVANTSDIGTGMLPFRNTYTKSLYINPQVISGSVSHCGKFIVEDVGTTTTKGVTRLEVGNFIEEGREGNSQGCIQIFNNDIGSVTLEAGHDDDRDIRVYLPENPGTLITSDDLSGYAKSTHNHSASNITSGILPIARGGTGNSNGYVQIGALSGSTVGALATAEGRNTTASGSYSHAEGNYTEATGSSSHAEGQNTTASNTASHAEGENTTASGAYSHAEGENTIASSKHQHVQGKFNKEDATETYAHIVGNGTGASTSSRSNAHTIDWDGNGWFAGDVYVGGISQSDTDASKLISEADHEWTQIYDSTITSAVNSISNINISGYKKIMVAVKCVNSANSAARAGSVILKASTGTTYQFPVWTNLFTTSANTSAGIAEFDIINGYIVCPYATRSIKTSSFLSSTEGGTADNLTSTGGGIMKCTKDITSLTVSSLDQDTNFYFNAGSRVIVWGCKA